VKTTEKIVIISNIIRYDYHGGVWGVGGDGVMCAWVWRGVEGCRYCNMTPQRPWSYRKYLHMRHVFKILMFYRASICSIPDIRYSIQYKCSNERNGIKANFPFSAHPDTVCHGLINYILDTKAKCRHLKKKLTCKGTCERGWACTPSLSKLGQKYHHH
jgi:hypothetical protein